ncbi:hypothetical protein NDU88_000663 [Pleurodeles waltl]|uniref:Uncharacterized protein n=1 Tax=Pleurodeles waltl TaxID=8319 RepID=A0AAV7LY44_PLEWA|nr:hypothetical protein NDU88_000663 [Pleurodeles waltl]
MKDGDRTKTRATEENNHIGTRDENQPEEEETWSEDCWCPTLPFATPAPVTTHRDLWQPRVLAGENTRLPGYGKEGEIRRVLPSWH